MMRRVLLFVSTFFWALGWGLELPSGYGTTYVADKNYRLYAVVTGLPQSATKVTGTNVNFGVHGLKWEDPESAANEPWTSATVTGAELKVGGEAVNVPAPGSNASYYAKGIRIDSTHFEHGADFTIELKLTFHLSNSTSSKNVIVTLNLNDKDVHNEALVTKTLVTDQGQPNSHPDSYPSVAAVGAAAAKTKFESGNQYVPSSNEHTEAQMLAALPTASVFFAFTHGTWSGIAPKDNTEFVGWTEMAGAPLQSTIFPGRSLAFFYACSTGSSGYAAPAALGMMAGESTYRANAGVVGFPDIVWSLLKQGDSDEEIPGIEATTPLSEHSAKLLDDLLSGLTISEAVQNANEDFPPRTAPDLNSGDPPDLVYTPMLVKADPLAKLHHVYKGGDPIIVVEAAWYLVYVVPPIQV